MVKAGKTYGEKLKDPRWQRKRLEVLSRDDFTCRFCSDAETTLHVHHTYYQRGNEPWDYPLDAFLTLCVDCHKDIDDSDSERREYEETLVNVLRKRIPTWAVLELAAAFLDFDPPHMMDPSIKAIANLIGSPPLIKEITNRYIERQAELRSRRMLPSPVALLEYKGE